MKLDSIAPDFFAYVDMSRFMGERLTLTVDPQYSSVMDYFEIFMGRMLMCRKAAEKLGLQFKLMINEQQLI